MEAATESVWQRPAVENKPPFAGKAGWLLSGDSREGAMRSEAQAGRPRVLVVEDDPFLLGLYARILNDSHLRVDQCADGCEALEKLSTTAYELVLLDVNLPGMDGISLAQWVQRHRPMSRTVVISGDTNPATILAARQAGAREFLPKPFSLLQFQETVARLTHPLYPSEQQFFPSPMAQVE
jgi:DNA-binding response OmpR family regulator